MQYMQGGSVRDLLDKFGNFDERIVFKYIKQALFGLLYLHERGIVHGNLKSSNLLVGSKGNIKLCDFFNEGMQETEQFDDQKFRDLKAKDIKLIGATTIEMLTGTFPDLVPDFDINKLDLTQQCKSFLTLCFDSSMTITQLLEHELMKSIQLPDSITKNTSPSK